MRHTRFVPACYLSDTLPILWWYLGAHARGNSAVNRARLRRNAHSRLLRSPRNSSDSTPTHTIGILCSGGDEGGREGGRASVAMGLVSFPKVILPALVGSSVVSYIFWDLVRNRKIFGGTVPRSIQGREWEDETNRKLDAWPREAAGPVVMNPISRQNYHKA